MITAYKCNRCGDVENSAKSLDGVGHTCTPEGSQFMEYGTYEIDHAVNVQAQLMLNAVIALLNAPGPVKVLVRENFEAQAFDNYCPEDIGQGGFLSAMSTIIDAAVDCNV